jgi:hypothetical protein
MKTDETESGQTVVPVGHATLGGAHLRTLQALFRHPTAHNLEWMDVIALFGKIGTVHQKANAKFALELAGEHYLLQKAHTKDLTSSEVVDLRHFLQRAGWSPEGAPQAAARRDLEPAVLVVVVDHHGAKLYRVEPGSGGASAHQIRPYDPHHYLRTRISRVRKVSAPRRTTPSMRKSALRLPRPAKSLWWGMARERATRRGTLSNTCVCTTTKHISESCAKSRPTSPRSRCRKFWSWPSGHLG